MSLSEAQKRQLRKLGHKLKPTIMIGTKGLTDGVRNETENTLDYHELIKIKVSGVDREARDETISTICEHCNAELIQRVGNIALIYRCHPKKPKIHLS
jgi:RNA-binding protein